MDINSANQARRALAPLMKAFGGLQYISENLDALFEAESLLNQRRREIEAAEQRLQQLARDMESVETDARTRVRQLNEVYAAASEKMASQRAAHVEFMQGALGRQKVAKARAEDAEAVADGRVEAAAARMAEAEEAAERAEATLQRIRDRARKVAQDG